MTKQISIAIQIDKLVENTLQYLLFSHVCNSNPDFQSDSEKITRGAGESQQHILGRCISDIIELSHACLVQPFMPLIKILVVLNLPFSPSNRSSQQFVCQRSTPTCLDQMMNLCTLQCNARVLLSRSNLLEMCNFCDCL